MNSIVNYGSDDDCDDSSEEKVMDSYMGGRNHRRSWATRQDDANYDEVQMSLSEDSSDECKSSSRESHHQRRPPPRDEGGTAGHREPPGRRWDVRGGSQQRERPTERREERTFGSSKGDREDERPKDGGREEDRTRERYRGEKEDDRPRERRGKSRDRYSGREDRYKDDRYRDRKDRDRRRSRSPRDRDRRRSRSPRRQERSRSRDRDRDRVSSRAGYAKRYERGNKERFERPGPGQNEPKAEEKPENKDRFFVPGITGRFREQIEKRKLLWQKKEPEVQPRAPTVGVQAPLAGGSRTTKVWEATTFAQDTDGKVANKFKRLMGIRNVGEGSNAATDVLKKQEEMFSSMEQQYEVARTATHTMRGVGLGFGSFQR